MFVASLKQLQDVGGIPRERILVLDMDTLNESGVGRLATFLGLDPSGWGEAVNATHNAGSEAYHDHFWDEGKGRSRESERSKRAEPGRYEISGLRPMLAETRALIYNRTREACQALAAEWGVGLARCLG